MVPYYEAILILFFILSYKNIFILYPLNLIIRKIYLKFFFSFMDQYFNI